jgi:VWFA-related protein
MLGLVLSSVLAAGSTSPFAAPEGTQVFPSRVELVAVDLIVVDGNGRPVRDLTPAEFRVQVGGRPRHVVSAEFLAVAQEPDEPAPASEAGFTTNETVRPGRLVLLVVDTSSIPAGRGRDELAAATRMLDRLGSSDRVGLLTIPSSGPREEFTTDHERIREALEKVVGQGRLRARHISLVEALSCSEQDAASGNDERCAQAMQRECGQASGNGLALCRDEITTEAAELANEYRRTSATSRAMLQSTFEALRQVEGQKVVVLVSQGFGLSDVGAVPGGGGLELRQLGAAAAAARVAFYVVPVRSGTALPGADSDLPVVGAELDRTLLSWGLESLAVEARGAVFRGDPARAFERVLRETSGYYRLGFEPEAADRDGKQRKLQVAVTRPGLVVRTRPSVTLQPGGSGHETKGDLLAALRSPTLATGLPLRVATWSLAGDQPGMVRVLIGAEIGGDPEAQGLTIGYVLFDANGKVAASATQAMNAETAGRGAIPYSASATVAPGAYKLRLVVRDGRGRLGSVDHPLEAGLVRAGALALSDLLLGPAPEAGRAFRPLVVPTVKGDVLLVHGEVSGAEDALAAASVLLEIVASEGGTTARTAAARLVAAKTAGRRVVQGLLPLQGLPPGSYLARIVVASGGIPRGAVVRPFRVSPQ